MNSRKLTNFLLATLLVILVGFLSYYLFVMRDHSWGDSSKNNASTTQSDAVLSTTAQLDATTTVIAAPQVSSQKISDHNSTQQYAIDITYPKISGLSDASLQTKINANLSSLVQGEIKSFKDSLKDQMATEEIDSSEENTMQITFVVNDKSPLPNVLSFVLDESFYSAGATHAGHSIFALNYNLKDGSLITLDSLFKKGSNYLNVLSSYTKADLTRQLSAKNNIADADMIQEGTNPNADNFAQFILTQEGLKILFNEYQVASYAAGQRQVIVPWSALQSILSSNAPANI